MVTGTAINIISENAFRALTRKSPVPVQLLPYDLIVVGVTGSSLQIIGKVNPAVHLEEKVSPVTTHFCVTTACALPMDG